MLHNAVKAGTERFGSIIEQILACAVLRAYVEGKMYREAINYADAVVNKSNVLKLQDVGIGFHQSNLIEKAYLKCTDIKQLHYFVC